MSQHDDAKRMYANRILKGAGGLLYKTNPNSELQEFVDSMELPPTGLLGDHQRYWNKFYTKLRERGIY